MYQEWKVAKWSLSEGEKDISILGMPNKRTVYFAMKSLESHFDSKLMSSPIYIQSAAWRNNSLDSNNANRNKNNLFPLVAYHFREEITQKHRLLIVAPTRFHPINAVPMELVATWSFLHLDARKSEILFIRLHTNSIATARPLVAWPSANRLSVSNRYARRWCKKCPFQSW
jgi:hypothetical protein